MGKIGIIYSFNSTKTKAIAAKVFKQFEVGSVIEVDLSNCTKQDFLQFDYYILGVPTWFDGELPNYWEEFLPELEDENLKGKKVAIYGLGDQIGYPENFCDAIGIMATFLSELGAEIVGKTEAEEYTFEKSRAVENGQFLGLPLDQENEGRLSEERIERWVNGLLSEFK